MKSSDVPLIDPNKINLVSEVSLKVTDEQTEVSYINGFYRFHRSFMILKSLDLQLPREATNKLRLYWHCLIAGENYTPVIESVKIEGE